MTEITEIQPDASEAGATPSTVEPSNGSERPVEVVRDRRIASSRPLISPRQLRTEVPLTPAEEHSVVRGREEVARILDGTDDRLLVLVGPCSIHDPAAGLDYARRLAAVADAVSEELCVVMRVYFEKPRTTLGWKGLINDPGLDGSFAVNQGLRAARALLVRILDLGLRVGCEFLDPITPQYLADTVSWGSIGARTAQSQIHRQLTSGLSMPVGIKNSTEGDVQAAVDAITAARSGHVFTGITDEGMAAILTTTGNPDCHLVLRGGSTGPNYDAAGVAQAVTRLRHAGLGPRLVIDASHGNSGKDHTRQPAVVADIANRVAQKDRALVGVMIESFLVAGRQELTLGQSPSLTYGQSVTDACLDWESTVPVLAQLADAVRSRRIGA